ncbi:MAG TPA: sulfurtransferase [Burkholderiales bacterium]|nr:sulfurtransferase [Burkholderiales bacterium]
MHSQNSILVGHLLALLLTALPFGARSADQLPIVDTGFVEQAVARGALIWDVRSQEEYRRGHIPGAVNIDEVALVLREPATEDYIALERIERLLGDAGIDPTREVVLYGAKAHTSPYFGYVTVRYLGGSAARVYHGGIDDWKAAGKPVDTEPVKLPPLTFRAKVNPDVILSTREVVARLGAPGVQIIDARTEKEFSGEDVRALRGGRIPGAVNVPYETNWLDPDTPRKLQRRQVAGKDGMNLKPPEDLRALYARLDPQKETIVYCQSGVRAAETATVLQSLGFHSVKVYDSSWLGYGNAFDAPAENVTYFNVGRVNGLLMQMQQRIELLEGQIEDLKAAKEKK